MTMTSYGHTSKLPKLAEYIHGQPSTKNVVNHLSGSSIGAISLLTTAPRYIASNSDSLGPIHFHHMLYANGAPHAHRPLVVRSARKAGYLWAIERDLIADVMAKINERARVSHIEPELSPTVGSNTPGGTQWRELTDFSAMRVVNGYAEPAVTRSPTVDASVDRDAVTILGSGPAIMRAPVARAETTTDRQEHVDEDTTSTSTDDLLARERKLQDRSRAAYMDERLRVNFAVGHRVGAEWLYSVWNNNASPSEALNSSNQRELRGRREAGTHRDIPQSIGITQPGRMGHSVEPTERVKASEQFVDYTFTPATDSTLKADSNPSASPIFYHPKQESYLFPTSRMLIRVYVPPSATTMCLRKNKERSKMLETEGRGSTSFTSFATEATTAETYGIEKPFHDIRAVDGDIVYIPSGWGYELFKEKRRILKDSLRGGSKSGPAQLQEEGGSEDGVVKASHQDKYNWHRYQTPGALNPAHELSAGSTAGSKGSKQLLKVQIRSPPDATPTLNSGDSPTYTSTYQRKPNTWSVNKGGRTSNEGAGNATETQSNTPQAAEASLAQAPPSRHGGSQGSETCHIACDCFRVFYEPYPRLSPEQERHYLATYYSSSVGDFYDKGGNNPLRPIVH